MRDGFLPRMPAYAIALIGMLGILVVAIIDYVSGVELRVGPLYYVPLSLVAWELERRTVVAAAVLCAICVTIRSPSARCRLLIRKDMRNP